jgi:pyrroloquinoline quinone biosynthesis protein D
MPGDDWRKHCWASSFWWFWPVAGFRDGLPKASAVTARNRTVLAPSSIPRFPRGTRFRFDATRQAWVILAPERLMMPDEIASEVLKLVDGERTVAAIAEQLATQFGAPRDEVLADTLSMLQELADDTVLEDARPAEPPPP